MVQASENLADEIARLRAQAEQFRSLAIGHRAVGNHPIAAKLTEAAADCDRRAAQLQLRLASGAERQTC